MGATTALALVVSPSFASAVKAHGVHFQVTDIGTDQTLLDIDEAIVAASRLMMTQDLFIRAATLLTVRDLVEDMTAGNASIANITVTLYTADTGMPVLTLAYGAEELTTVLDDGMLDLAKAVLSRSSVAGVADNAIEPAHIARYHPGGLGKRILRRAGDFLHDVGAHSMSSKAFFVPRDGFSSTA